MTHRLGRHAEQEEERRGFSHTTNCYRNHIGMLASVRPWPWYLTHRLGRHAGLGRRRLEPLDHALHQRCRVLHVQPRALMEGEGRNGLVKMRARMLEGDGRTWVVSVDVRLWTRLAAWAHRPGTAPAAWTPHPPKTPATTISDDDSMS